jgi:hypothetical protein
MIDLIRRRFGRLIVVRRVDNNKWGNSRWLCKCDCELGTEKIILGCHLQSNHTQSCGCLQKEKLIKRSTKHGHAKRGEKSKVYRSWLSMVQRCINPKDEKYCIYGNRGIMVCEHWMKFENFLEDMGEVPSGHQIDRINNNGNYCKSNCRWATRKQQMRNTRQNHLITYNGETQCLIEWAEEYKISYKVLKDRINKLDWSIGKALTTKVRKRKKKEGK